VTTTILFYAYAAVAVAGAVGLVAARRLLHGVMSLFATLVAIGGLYLLMGMEFLAAMQLFVYGGAITVLVMFALMLAGPRAETVDMSRRAQRWVAGIVAGLFALAVGFIVGAADWQVVPAYTHDTASIATILFSRYALPFEIAGLSLTIALIGAVVIARQDDLGEQAVSSLESARPADGEANAE
jgi:NADH-quinone oxidoreductase subunit J